MKQFFVFILLVVAAFSYQAMANSAVEDNYIELSNTKEVRYVVVYKMNGVVHAVLIDHYVNCADLIDANPLWNGFGIEILDCGPVGDVSVPSGTTYVAEETALNHFQLSEWP